MTREGWFQHKRGEASAEKLARLEELQNLKGEHLLTSTEAFRHMRDNEIFERLLDSAQKTAGITASVTLSEVKNFCEKARNFIQQHLRYVSAIVSTPEDWSVLKQSGVAAYNDRPETHVLNDTEFTLDYENLVATLLQGRAAQPEISLPDLTKTLLTTLIRTDVPCIVLLESGEKIGVQTYAREAKYRKEDLESHRDSIEYLDLDPDCPPEELHAKLVQRLAPETQLREALRALTDDDPDISISDLRHLHNFSELYERAEREYTLGTLHVQRRLAIAAVLGHSQGENGRERVAEALKNVDGMIRRHMEFDSHGHEYIERINRHSLEKARYKRKAIIENRRFLEDYFS